MRTCFSSVLRIGSYLLVLKAWCDVAPDHHDLSLSPWLPKLQTHWTSLFPWACSVCSPGSLHRSSPSPNSLQPAGPAPPTFFPLMLFWNSPDIIICKDNEYSVTSGYCWVLGVGVWDSFTLKQFLQWTCFYLLLTVLQISPAMNVFSLNIKITPIAVVGENLNKKKNVMCLSLREKIF